MVIVSVGDLIIHTFYFGCKSNMRFQLGSQVSIGTEMREGSQTFLIFSS